MDSTNNQIIQKIDKIVYCYLNNTIMSKNLFNVVKDYLQSQGETAQKPSNAFKKHNGNNQLGVKMINLLGSIINTLTSVNIEQELYSVLGDEDSEEIIHLKNQISEISKIGN